MFGITQLSGDVSSMHLRYAISVPSWLSTRSLAMTMAGLSSFGLETLDDTCQRNSGSHIAIFTCFRVWVPCRCVSDQSCILHFQETRLSMINCATFRTRRSGKQTPLTHSLIWPISVVVVGLRVQSASALYHPSLSLGNDARRRGIACRCDIEHRRQSVRHAALMRPVSPGIFIKEVRTNGMAGRGLVLPSYTLSVHVALFGAFRRAKIRRLAWLHYMSRTWSEGRQLSVTYVP